MLYGAVDLLRERGVAALTVDGVLERTGAPRGSVYYHFPGGRSQILSEALELAGSAISSIFERSTSDGLMGMLHSFGDFWAMTLRDSDFEAGCPVVSVAIGGTPDERDLTPAVKLVMSRWHQIVASVACEEGVDPVRAERLATLTIACTEGAIILCRVERSLTPLEDVIAELEGVFRTALGDR